jgi:hypothetical protein
MKRKITYIIIAVAISSCAAPKKNTVVSIKENQFFINDEITYKGRYLKGNKVEGLLFNARMVQAIFDDLNPATKDQFKYPDTKIWDANRNTDEFVAAMAQWKSHGLLCFTINLQGGSPTGYGNKGWINSAFDTKGSLRPAYIQRLKKVADAADKLGMVVIAGYFYFGQDEQLENETAVINAVDNITSWILKNKYKNILVEINNECDISYDHTILQSQRVAELIKRVQQHKKKNYRLLVSTSYSGGTLPQPAVLKTADFILLHGNNVSEPAKITAMVTDTKKIDGYHNQPILFNEDDHFNFEDGENNFMNAVCSYASWGYFDYRMNGEGFKEGYQSVPVDWGINAERKKQFFKKLKEITGY